MRPANTSLEDSYPPQRHMPPAVLEAVFYFMNKHRRGLAVTALGIAIYAVPPLFLDTSELPDYTPLPGTYPVNRPLSDIVETLVMYCPGQSESDVATWIDVSNDNVSSLDFNIVDDRQIVLPDCNSTTP